MANNNRTDNDTQITERILHNDHGAFKELFNKYYPFLYRFAYYRLKSRDLTCDLIQDLFFNLWSNRERLNPKKSIKAYLYKSLLNSIINYKKLFFSQHTSLESNSKQETDIESALEMNIDFRDALEKLSDKQSIVFMLSRYDGFKYSEIAEICGISVKAVEKRMSSAFSTLKNYLEEKK
jgi:RNA polymerase sigma-70 factor (family 1)